MYPYLLELGPVTIGSLGAMIALGFLTAHYLLQRGFRRLEINPDLASTIVTGGMIGGIVGSKLYFVLFEMPGVGLDGRLDALFSGYGLTWYGGFILNFFILFSGFFLHWSWLVSAFLQACNQVSLLSRDWKSCFL